MLFSELEEVLEDLSRNKQRLTVSRHAYNILLQSWSQKSARLHRRWQ